MPEGNWLEVLKNYVDALETRLTAARAGYLDELAAANIPADIDTLIARLTALRAGYLDELDFDLNARLGAPAGASLSADLLTIDNLIDDLETRLTAARAGYLDNINNAQLANLTAQHITNLGNMVNFQHEIEWASTPAIQQVASAAATNLTAGSITPTFPTNSTRVRCILIASIKVVNTAANTHSINFKIQGQKAAGGYSDQLDLTAQAGLGLVNVAGAGDSWAGAIDVTTLVDASAAAYDFRFVVDSDNAGAVNYITAFTLVEIYRI